MVRSLVPGVSFPHEVKQPLQVVGVGLAVEQRALSPTLPHFGSHSAQTETTRSLIFIKITKANDLQKVPSNIVITQLLFALHCLKEQVKLGFTRACRSIEKVGIKVVKN